MILQMASGMAGRLSRQTVSCCISGLDQCTHVANMIAGTMLTEMGSLESWLMDHDYWIAMTHSEALALADALVVCDGAPGWQVVGLADSVQQRLLIWLQVHFPSLQISAEHIHMYRNRYQ